MSNLYERIYALCEEKGIKGAKMCSDTGISKGLLTDLKMGRRTGVSAVTAQKIASYFGVSVGYLLGEEAKKKNDTQTDIVVRLRTDDNFASIIEGLNQLDEVQLASVKLVVDAFLSAKK